MSLRPYNQGYALGLKGLTAPDSPEERRGYERGRHHSKLVKHHISAMNSKKDKRATASFHKPPKQRP